MPVFLLTVVFPMLPTTRAALHRNLFGFALTPLLKWAFTTPVQVSVHEWHKRISGMLPDDPHRLCLHLIGVLTEW